MVTREEKKKCLAEVIQMAATSGQEKAALKTLYDLLLRDSNGGKLYKYRSFDSKGFSLKNFRAGTLHCSAPEKFNDPFDCKIGVTFGSVYQALYGEELDYLSEIFTIFSNVVHHEINPDTLAPEEQALVQKLLLDSELTDFVAKNRGIAISDQEGAAIIQQNIAIILRFVKIVLEDEHFGSVLRVTATMLPKLFEQLSPEGLLEISKDDATLEDYARAVGVTKDEDEIGLTMTLSLAFNKFSTSTL